jgi:hypothetical protein
VQNSHFTKRVNRLGAEHPRQVAWLLAVGTAVHFGYAYHLFDFARSDSGPRAGSRRPVDSC